MAKLIIELCKKASLQMETESAQNRVDLLPVVVFLIYKVLKYEVTEGKQHFFTWSLTL